MSRPSLLWYALRDLGRDPLSDPEEVGAVLAQAVEQAPHLDPNETHLQGASNGKFPMPLLANALQGWRRPDQTGFSDEVPTPLAIEAPARALLDRGAQVWTLPEDQRARVIGSILTYGLWDLWEAVLALPDRPDWATVMGMTADMTSPWDPKTLWSRIATRPQMLPGLVRAGLPADYTHANGQTLLFAHDDIEVARWCVAQGASASAVDDQGKNAAAHHRPHLNVEQQKDWFDLCGRDLSAQDQIRLAWTSSKSGFLQVVKKPGDVRWSPQPGVEVNVLDAAIHTAVPNRRYKETQPALFHHLIDTAIVWPETSRAMAALAWIASPQPENTARKARMEARLADVLTLEAMTAALPQWLSYIETLDPKTPLHPYRAWWDHSADRSWQRAVLEVQIAHLHKDPSLWRKEVPLLFEPGRLGVLLNAAAAGQPLDEWTCLPSHHRFALAAWRLSSHPALNPNKTTAYPRSRMGEEAILREIQSAMRVLKALAAEGQYLTDPQWADWRAAMEGLRGDPLHEMISSQRNQELQQRPAITHAARPRRRS